MTDFDNPSNGPRRRTWWIAAAVLALLALAYSGFWFTLATAVRVQAVQWIERQRERGYAVRYDSLEATGFPLSIRLDIANPGFGAPNQARPWGWEGPHLTLIIKPWDREKVHAVTSGQQMLAFPLNGKAATYTGNIERAHATIGLSGGEPHSAALMLKGIDLNPEKPGPGPIRIAEADYKIARLAIDKADHQTATWSMAGSTKGLSLPWFKASPLGSDVQHLSVDGSLLGILEKGPVIESLENWRDRGGTIELKKLHVQNGPLKFQTDGTLALDAQLQPIGALTARIEGFFETIDALQRLGLIKPRDAVTAKMVLGVLSRKSVNGGPATLNLALTLQEGRLFAGPVGLLEIPKVDWRTFTE